MGSSPLPPENYAGYGPRAPAWPPEAPAAPGPFGGPAPGLRPISGRVWVTGAVAVLVATVIVSIVLAVTGG
jgi:hypothetical protein